MVDEPKGLVELLAPPKRHNYERLRAIARLARQHAEELYRGIGSKEQIVGAVAFAMLGALLDQLDMTEEFKQILEPVAERLRPEDFPDELAERMSEQGVQLGDVLDALKPSTPKKLDS